MKKFQILKFKIPNYKRGFTLVELLMYMGIMSILLVVLSAIFVAIVDVQLESEATTYVEQDSRYIFAKLMHDIYAASSITSPSLGGQNTNLQIVRNGINYSYTIDGNGNFVVADTSGTYQLNSSESSISNISFQRIGNVNGKHTIKVSMTITSKTVRSSGPEVRTVQTTIGVR